MVQKKFVPYLFIKEGKAVTDFGASNKMSDGDGCKIAKSYSDNGADEILIFDLSDSDAEHEQSIGIIKEISRNVDIPLIGGGNIKRAEDVKKLIYAGCRKVFLNYEKDSNIELTEEVSRRFGKEKIAVCLRDEETLKRYREKIETFASEIVYLVPEESKCDFTQICTEQRILPVFMGEKSEEEMWDCLKSEQINGICCKTISAEETDFMELKYKAKGEGICVNTFESSMKFEEFKLNGDGLIPVIVQDYKTEEVLMLAYMNKEAFETTIRTGRMTYFSRSRQELWMKGMTSGHIQYVKQLLIDCDQDTILAKVAQIGAACHTGNRSCFYRNLVKKEYHETNPMKVFEQVYSVIEDRKKHPKEGSYTNYLFEKGIDKILKKVGEEATEIVIAAKNPNPEEIKYEISDFLYHVMVLMCEKGVTWEDITRELADR
ncbi:MAG: bifunctional phosphoribosyl-AMP cyclohydrolase/phosphoribosyl-ATP diphosphatase HisIE [Eubacteriales bacterium]|nr:bifunctional phosphoribosyl-AMP cyclohydrolase/phosphoribosyl-ATP diphosphatase HisIE [Eubacteriales bacterium]